MRNFLGLLTLALWLAASLAAQPDADSGTFYVQGVAYQYRSNQHYSLVTTASPVGKFLAVTVYVANHGAQSLTIRPENVSLEDQVGEKEMGMIPASEVAARMRGGSKLGKFAAEMTIGNMPPEMPPPSAQDMSMAMSHMAGMTMAPPGRNAEQAESADERDAFISSCDIVCEFRMRPQGTRVQQQQLNQPDYVERTALLANTLPPYGSVEGVVYWPMPQAPAAAVTGKKMKKAYHVKATVHLAGDTAAFVFPAEPQPELKLRAGIGGE